MLRRTKKVAIIGAGPSGLVAAKTLLHNYPPDTFSPTIFEKSPGIGGLWPTSGSQHSPNRRGLIDPSMRTNLSRFTVGFSDFAWESVLPEGEVGVFPRARQVGEYLEGYVERYVPGEVLRFGCRILGTEREEVEGRGGWVVRWECGRDGDDGNMADAEIKSEYFDFLIVASGYFSRPHIPDIPGLESLSDKTVHSSSLHTKEDMDKLLQKAGPTGKLVVIGGSMSGVETASALALHLSSLDFTPGSQTQDKKGKAYEVHHICPKPFWTVPYYLPHETPQEDTTPTTQFLPLDLVFYDLARRPPGQIEYAFGPASVLQAARVNGYFASMLGSNYAGVGGIGVNLNNNNSEIQPSWVAIGDNYAEFVRSGRINTTIGRVASIHKTPTGQATMDINLPGQEPTSTSIDNVAAIITATGFTPFSSLSFLPEDILSTLEFAPSDPFFPLILDGKGSSHADIPDLGFVGFYRGPYWGVMEMQARNIAESFFQASENIPTDAEKLSRRAEERQRVRNFRAAGSNVQFPMGDYVGLMESFARDLGIQREGLGGGGGSWAGPVVPARYLGGSRSGPGSEGGRGEAEVTVCSLRRALFGSVGESSEGMARAVFRALHGAWRVEGEGQDVSTVAFHPRYPTAVGVEGEYVFEMNGVVRSVWRLGGGSGASQIGVWGVGLDGDGLLANRFEYGVFVKPMEVGGVARTVGVDEGDGSANEYVLHFDGVAISSWERIYKRADGSTVTRVYTR